MAGRQPDHAEARRSGPQKTRTPRRGCLRSHAVHGAPYQNLTRPAWAARQMAMWGRVLNPPSARLDRAVTRNTSWPVVRAPESVGCTRRRLTAQLTAWGLEELVDTTQLVASELITNALRHTRGPIGVRVHVHGGLLRCEVEDADPNGPTRRTAPADAENGRGIELVDALAHNWGSHRTLTGKTTWFELPLPHQSRAATAAGR
ncbi:ATP-binding protein [Streptomyces sp. XY332]|uniref:ATP-binding protein n=1 Tax=Streptomyces sp. XY332 TaxID=1415561 RepID=UPI000B2E42FB|nr:ATP-binding protein [Streptomyces sp. XY332]